MTTPKLQPPEFRFPFVLNDQPKGVQDAHVWAFNAILDLQRANKVNVGKIAAVAPTTAATTGSTTTEIITNTINDILSGLGMVNDQTGVTAYTTQTSDAGALLILSDISPVAVSLNSVVTTPYALFITNFGAGLVTLTPTTGLINGGASLDLLQSQLVWVVFDGTNWKTSAVFAPSQTAVATAHKWLNSYTASTGAFTETQPDYSDLTGTPQLPITKTPVAGDYITGYDSTTGLFSASTTPGISATIVTAALTVGGTQGSMTFVDGILTAQTPAT